MSDEKLVVVVDYDQFTRLEQSIFYTASGDHVSLATN